MAVSASNAEILARLDSLLGLVCDLKDRFDTSEQTRQAFRSEYDRSSGETQKLIAVLDHRLMAAERRTEALESTVTALAKTTDELRRSTETLGTIVKIQASVLSAIGGAVVVWLIGQVLGLIK